MNILPVVEQVNRLVGNLLAGGVEVSLPGIGTLYIERREAQRLSKRSIQPPCRVVAFTSQSSEPSFVERIATVAGCDEEEARDIYDRWLARTFVDDVLTIEGVGVLKFKHFTPDPSFDVRLNPQGHKPVRIKPARRIDWALWIGILAILIAAGFGAREFLAFYPDEPQIVVVPEGRSDAAPAESTTLSADSLLAIAKAAIRAQTDSLNDDSKPAGTVSAEVSSTTVPNTSGEFTAGRYYVVMGVFSSRENALRAAAEAAAKDSTLRCGVYSFGSKFLVSAFDAPDADACGEFIRRQEANFPGMWTYTAR